MAVEVYRVMFVNQVAVNVIYSCLDIEMFKTLSVHFIDWWLCRSHSATQPLCQSGWCSHSATLPEWLEQPLSHSARVAGAATQPLSHSASCQSGWSSHSATLPEWLTQPLSYSARVAGAATQTLSHSARDSNNTNMLHMLGGDPWDGMAISGRGCWSRHTKSHLMASFWSRAHLCALSPETEAQWGIWTDSSTASIWILNKRKYFLDYEMGVS